MACSKQRIILSIMLCICFKAESQDYNYVHYDTKDGLAGATVYYSVQDKEGFMWFGTETGLSRFDGTNFTNFTTADGLPDNEIMKLFVDSKNRIWIIPFRNSVAYYQYGKIHNQQNDSLLSKLKITSEVISVAEDHAGRILVLESKAIHILSDSNTVTSIDHYKGNPFLALKGGVDARGNFNIFLVFISTGVYLGAIQGNQIELTEDVSSMYPNSYNSIILSANLKIIRIADSLRIWRQNTEQVKIYLPPGLINLCPLSDSLLSINTQVSTYLLNLKTGKITDHFLPDQTVYYTTLDAEGNLWFCTPGHGIYRLASTEFVNTTFRFQGQELPVFSIRKIGQTVFAGTDHYRLWNMSDKKLRDAPLVVDNSDTRGRIMSIDSIGPQKILLGTDNGLYVLKKNKVIYSIDQMSIKSVQLIQDKVLISSAQLSVILDLKNFGNPDTVYYGRSTCSFLKGNTTYLGTLNGLYLVKPDRSLEFPGEHYVPLRARITAIREDKKGIIWISTYGSGLLGLHNNQVLHHLTTAEGLTSNICKNIFLDSPFVWLCTDKGLNRIECMDSGFSIMQFTSADGLNDDNINSVYVDKSHIYAATSYGVTRFNANKISTKSTCLLRMTGIAVKGISRFGETVPLVVEHNFGSLKFQFSAISFRSGGYISFHYLLKNLDQNWKTTTENSITYNTLPSGKYLLSLYAANKFGVISNTIKVTFEVKPLFWEQWWVKITAGFLIFALLWLIFQMRTRLVRKKALQRFEAMSRIADIEQMALKSQMNPHFIFNCMNSIQQYVIDKDILGANGFITEFSHLIRQTLNLSNKKVISVNEEIDYISTYLRLEKKRFEDKFNFEISIDHSVNLEECMIPPMILQPYIENAIRHGINHKEAGSGKISVSFVVDNSFLHCTVEDNGIGRGESIRLKSQNIVPYQSHGMGLTAKRIELLNKVFDAPISVEVSDCFNRAVNPGTRVTLRFPLQQLAQLKTNL